MQDVVDDTPPGQRDVGQVDPHGHAVSSLPLLPVVKNLVSACENYLLVLTLHSIVSAYRDMFYFVSLYDFISLFISFVI